MDADRQQGEVASSNPEIDIIRAELIASPRPSGFPERRASLDALGGHYEMPAGVRVEPFSANGVSAEWTVPPEADHSRVLMFLHGGGYVSGSLKSHRHMVAELGRLALVHRFLETDHMRRIHFSRHGL